MSKFDFLSRARALDARLHQIRSRGNSDSDRIDAIESAIRTACADYSRGLANASASLADAADEVLLMPVKLQGMPRERLKVSLDKMRAAMAKV